MAIADPDERPSPSLGALMILGAGATVGFWLFLPPIREEAQKISWRDLKPLLPTAWLVAVGVLGGLSILGPPLLLRERARRRRRWGPGRFLWFVQGTASWLMWPPIVYGRLHTPAMSRLGEGMGVICYVYGTPLMALYVGLALLAGGRGRRRLRARLGPGWRERFGRALGLLWAIVGVGVLILIYRNDFHL